MRRKTFCIAKSHPSKLNINWLNWYYFDLIEFELNLKGEKYGKTV